MKVFHLFVLTWPSYQVRLLEVSAVDVNELKALTWNLFSVGPIKVNLALVLHVISDKMICLTLLQGVIIVLYLKLVIWSFMYVRKILITKFTQLPQLAGLQNISLKQNQGFNTLPYFALVNVLLAC